MHRVANLRLEAPPKQGDPYRTPVKAAICLIWPQEGDGRPVCIDTHRSQPPNQRETPLWAPSNPNASPIGPWGRHGGPVWLQSHLIPVQGANKGIRSAEEARRSSQVPVGDCLPDAGAPDRGSASRRFSDGVDLQAMGGTPRPNDRQRSEATLAEG